MIIGDRDFECPRGIAALDGTGFEGHGSTGWLVTHSKVTPGEEMTLRLAIWDMSDHVLDSTVLVDNFRFEEGDPATPMLDPYTEPVEPCCVCAAALRVRRSWSMAAPTTSVRLTAHAERSIWD
jgi:hypothetical protein